MVTDSPQTPFRSAVPDSALRVSRRIGTVQATALHMLRLVAAGPFTAIGLLMAAVGGPLALPATRGLAADAPTTQPAAWTVVGHIPRDALIIQSHRGAGELAPENTLEAFTLGWKLGTIPEADIRTTRDGVIVAFHDAAFNRVVRNLPAGLKDKGVKDVSWSELSTLDVGAWKGQEFEGRRVSRIGDVFALMTGQPGRRLYLDIKEVDLGRLAGEVRDHRVVRQVILASTRYEIIREWKRLVPESQTLLWMGGTESALRRRLADLARTDFADVTQLQIHVHLKDPTRPVERTGRDPFKLSDAFLVEAGTQLRTRGILYQTLPWGAATRDTYWKLLDLGVMSFATDHPQVTLDAVRAYYESGGRK